MNGNLMVLGAALLTAGAAFGGRIEAVRGEVSVRSGEARELWSLSHAKTGEAWSFAAPVFEIDGRPCEALVDDFAQVSVRTVFEGVDEYAWEGGVRGLPGARLRFVFRLAEGSPVVRFRYELRASGEREMRLTKNTGRDALVYLETDLARWPRRTEVCLSEFDEIAHSHRLAERDVRDSAFEDSLSAMGPIIAAEGASSAALLAYEHGSQSPDAFVRFDFSPSSRVRVRAVKGNYWNGRVVTAERPYETIWFDAALLPGTRDDAAAAFRAFQLRRCSPNAASRRPYVFYNSWAMQERDHWWRGSRKYLNTMNEKEILGEIDAAHEMGVDVFVVDAGWFEKTGDWRPSSARFPRGLKPLEERLAGYGMKLGLWFSPTEAAVTSEIVRRNPDGVMSFRGRASEPHPVWETEPSYNMCLVSGYWKDFADELVRIHREHGVAYFKWDAIGQYGCDSAAHFHGDASVPADERADCYAFEQVRYMARVVDRLCESCPEAIVDFDTTEGGRCVGLAFLASGKYFASNNGPYFHNLDNPYDWNKSDYWSNVYVYPGPARARVMRGSLDYDKWIPSVLFMSHYLPDEPRSSQLINLGSLVLGQNGVWGEMRKVAPEGRRLFGECLAAYKQVRDDITAASPVRVGRLMGSPEIHEKINGNGRGAVVVFANGGGEHAYVTEHRVEPVLWKGGDVSVDVDGKGRAVLRCRFDGAGACIVFFGGRQEAENGRQR